MYTAAELSELQQHFRVKVSNEGEAASSKLLQKMKSSATGDDDEDDEEFDDGEVCNACCINL